jgi:hypothetical protein
VCGTKVMGSCKMRLTPSGLCVVSGIAEGPGKPDANVRFVGTKGGAEMLGKDVGTYPALVSGMNSDEVGGMAVVAGP